MINFRVGHGYDVHALVEGRPLILAGVSIPYHRGLLGHSDADVITHALCDALLGAAGLRDIGHFFPDSDPRFRDIESLKLLGEVAKLLADRGWAVGNADITVICQEPKLAPYRQEMIRRLKVALGGGVAVNIKATTTEHLGFIGRGEAIAAHAVVLIVKKI
ncbi:2-C-methyl-D-erythritol 2,4-cyclodiphosphate synthase [Thermosulfuriphilus sp.]